MIFALLGKNKDYSLIRQLAIRGLTRETERPTQETDSHYHLKADCIRAVEKAFDPHHICIPEDLTLGNIHKEKIKAEFLVNLY